MALPIANRPTLVEWGPLRFLIMDTPREHNLHLYIKEMKNNNVTDVVRVCEKAYSAAEVEKAGIRMHEMEFDDGDSPPGGIITDWLHLVDETFKGVKEGNPSSPAIAVHCVAGLGRAPVLVAIACIERGADPLHIVKYIRNRRRGAINAKQLMYLENYAATVSQGCLSYCTIC